MNDALKKGYARCPGEMFTYVVQYILITLMLTLTEFYTYIHMYKDMNTLIYRVCCHALPQPNDTK